MDGQRQRVIDQAADTVGNEQQRAAIGIFQVPREEHLNNNVPTQA